MKLYMFRTDDGTEELSKTCRVSCQNKLVKLVHLVGFVRKRPLFYHLAVNHMVCFWHYWQDACTWWRWRLLCYIFERVRGI